MGFTAVIQANINDFTSNLDKAQARMDKFAQDVGEKATKLGRKLQTIGGAMSLAITAPITAIGKAAYDMAADFEDALGATDQIFKQSSEDVKEWANNLETYFGITKKEALEYSNLMGSMLVNIGNLTEKEAAKQGQALIELAGDLTAMYGGRTQDAVRALTGALKGNNTMLDNYGMAVNDALVKTRALELGLIKQGQEMSLSAKQAATLSLIYEQTGAAQGQAAREADGASGSMRALRTEITNLTTELGENLLPIITPIVQRLRDIISGFRDMSPQAKKVVTVIAAVAAAIGPALVAIGSLLKLVPLVGTAFAAITGPIGIAVLAIGAAVALIIKNWDSIKAYFTTGNGGKLWTSISEGAQALWNRLKIIFSAARDFVTAVWDKIGSNVIGAVQASFNTVLSVIDGVITYLTGVFDVFAALIRGDFSGAFEALQNLVGNVFKSLKNIIGNVLANVSQTIAGFLNLIGANGLAKGLENFAAFVTPAREEVKKLGEETDKATDAVNKQTDAFKTVTPAIDGSTKAVKDYRAELIELFASWGVYDYQVQSLSNQFKEFAKNAKLAGASAAEMARIVNKEIIEKGLLALGQKGVEAAGSGFTSGITIPAQIKVDADFSNLSEKLSNVKATFDSLVIELGDSISSGIMDMVGSIGEALASGENVFSAIGNSLINTIGGLAQSIGKQMIAFGVAGLALKNLMKNPITAIAAGAALLALGSAAKSSISKQVSGAGYSGGTGGGVSTNYQQSAPLRGAYASNEKVTFEISGTTLKGVLDRQNNKDNRTGG